MSKPKWQMVRHGEGSEHGQGALTEQDAAAIEVAPEALSVLREFYRDVKAVGLRQTKEEWPDLYETWRRARSVLTRLAERSPDL